MQILLIVLVLALISIVWAVLTLRGLNSRSEAGEVTKKLSYGRVIFQDSSSPSDE